MHGIESPSIQERLSWYAVLKVEGMIETLRNQVDPNSLEYHKMYFVALKMLLKKVERLPTLLNSQSTTLAGVITPVLGRVHLTPEPKHELQDVILTTKEKEREHSPLAEQDEAIAHMIEIINAPRRPDEDHKEYYQRLATASRMKQGSAVLNTMHRPTRMLLTHIPLAHKWLDRVAYQCMQLEDLAKIGTSLIDDQQITFNGHKPIEQLPPGQISPKPPELRSPVLRVIAPQLRNMVNFTTPMEPET